jgi:hypothetical protein
LKPPHRFDSFLCFPNAGVTQLVECNLAKVDVASSSLVTRSSLSATTRCGLWRPRKTVDSQQKSNTSTPFCQLFEDGRGRCRRSKTDPLQPAVKRFPDAFHPQDARVLFDLQCCLDMPPLWMLSHLGPELGMMIETSKQSEKIEKPQRKFAVGFSATLVKVTVNLIPRNITSHTIRYRGEHRV